MDKRKTKRHPSTIPVRIWGMVKGQPFRGKATALDVSWSGARLSGVEFFDRPGETISLQCGDQKGLFMVVWVGKKGTEFFGQVGLRSVDARKWLWGATPAELEAQSAPPPLEVIDSEGSRITRVSDDSGMFSQLEWRDDRRLHRRVPVNAAIKVQVTGQDVAQWGTCKDISPRGCCAKTPAPLPTGCRVELTFRINAREISASGIVRNFRLNDGMGIEFLKISKEDRDLLIQAGESKTPGLKLW